MEETHMGRLTALLVGIAALAVISTVAEAVDGCGRGWYYDGRGCVPLNQPDYNQPPPPDYYQPPAPGYYQPPPPPPAGYYQPPPIGYYEPPVERGPQLRFDPDDDEARYSPPNPAFKTWNNCPPNFTVQDGLCKPYTGR
jgi:hypothetical protein